MAELHGRILDVCEQQNVRVQIVFVDDGSTDKTWQKMVSLCGTASDQFHSTIALRLRRNFGKAAALSAGFSVARGSIVFTMDADLQDDPTEIPRFLEKIQGGLDVVSGWKQTRHDPWHKVLPSRVFNALVSSLTGVRLHDHNCGFKAYRREVLAEVDLYGERHRFSSGRDCCSASRSTTRRVEIRRFATGQRIFGFAQHPSRDRIRSSTASPDWHRWFAVLRGGLGGNHLPEHQMGLVPHGRGRSPAPPFNRNLLLLHPGRPAWCPMRTGWIAGRAGDFRRRGSRPQGNDEHERRSNKFHIEH